MSTCPSCNTHNNKFHYISKKIAQKEFHCISCEKPLYLNGLKNTLSLSIGGALGGVLLLKVIYYTESNSSPFSIAMAAAITFLGLFIFDLLKMKFSLHKIKRTKPKIEAEKPSEDHLKEIYAQRSTEQLENMVKDSRLAPEAKVLVLEILAERIKKAKS